MCYNVMKYFTKIILFFKKRIVTNDQRKKNLKSLDAFIDQNYFVKKI